MNKKPIIMGIFALLALASCGGGAGDGGNVSYEPVQTYDGPTASGVYNWTTKPDGMSQADWVDTQSELLYKMEDYAMMHHLAGIPLYDDSSLELFSSRIHLASETYISGYGFGLNESTLDPAANMYNGQPFVSNDPSNPSSFFQSYATQDSGTMNYWDSQGEDVAGKNAMIASSLYTVVMDSKEEIASGSKGYHWTNGLAKDYRPIPLDDNGNEVEYKEGETYTKWRVHVFTGEDEGTAEAGDRHFEYAISPKSKYYAKYNGRKIELEDYLTPFRAILDNGLVRASGLITDSSGFLGASDYLYSGDGRDWSTVGIQLNESEGALDFEFVTPKTQFYAMYNLSSTLYSPIPEDYLIELGGGDPATIDEDSPNWSSIWGSGCRNFGKIGSGSDYTMTVDNLLSCGPYYVTYWEQGKRAVYTRNPNYYDAANIHFQGYTETVYKDENAAYRDFISGLLDNVTCPSDNVSDHTGKDYAHPAEGSTILKINLNSCTSEEWEYFFGTNGTMYTHSANNYWDVKWLMSDDDFLDGLFFSINRQQLAKVMGRNPSVGYLSDAYKIDPENDLSYRDTTWGKKAVERYTSVNPYGYSTSTAQTLYENAIVRGIGTGKLNRNTRVNLTFIWRYQSSIDKIGQLIADMITQTFNAVGSKYGITLTITNKVAGASYTDAYTLMDRGEFDLAEGAITGNVLNPLEFMSVICTNSLSQGFTCNWGEETEKVSATYPILWDADGDGTEEAYSYDAFYTACNGAAIVENGLNVAVASMPKDEADRFYTEGDTIYFLFDTPASIIDPETYEPLINFSYGFVWFFVARGTTTSGYYYDLTRQGFASRVTFNETQNTIEVPMTRDEVYQYWSGLAEEAGSDYDNVCIYLQVTADFESYGITRTAIVQTYVSMTALGFGQ